MCRRGLAALLSLMLVLAPVAVSADHGPGAVAAALHIAAADASHQPAHTADAAAHDATDHEHLVSGLLPGGGGSYCPLATTQAAVACRSAAGLVRDGPRRPPRDFSI